MDDNSLSIDLRKVKKSMPPPPVAVAPLSPGASMSSVQAPSAPMPSAPVRSASMLPPKPKMKMLPGWAGKLPPMRYMIFAVIVLGLIAAGLYIYVRFWTHSPFGPTAGTPADGQIASAAATTTAELSEADIIDRVGKLILVPSDETPSLAKVSDPSALQSQAFFKNAVTGDVVLMYAKALRAILYDPIQNKVIEVGPIAEASSTSTAAK